MGSQISYKNVFVPGSTGNNVKVVPGKRANTGSVSFIRVDEGLLDAVPKLNFSWVCTDGKGISSGVEIRTCDHVLITNIDQSDNFGVSSIPQIHWVAQAHCK